MLVGIPGRNVLKAFVPTPPPPARRSIQALPAAVRADATTLLAAALAAAAGKRAVASLTERDFSAQVRRHITAKLKSGQRIDSSVRLETLHLRPSGDRLDAVGSAATAEANIGYMAQFEPAHSGSTLRLRMRNFRVLT